MTAPLYALIALILLVPATKVPVAVAMHRSNKKGYDNRTPRAQQAALTGWGARAFGAHQNTFEALMIFTAAVVCAHFGGTGATPLAANLALAHTAARILYPVLYIADIHIVRSAVWGVGFISAVVLALSPLF
jgi:uncharacterized MAPEG superfamily protein